MALGGNLSHENVGTLHAELTKKHMPGRVGEEQGDLPMPTLSGTLTLYTCEYLIESYH